MEIIKLSATTKDDAENLIEKFPDLEIRGDGDIVEIWGPENYAK